MRTQKSRHVSGISYFDNLLAGLYIGDNVIWYDDAGSLAPVFCLNFIKETCNQKKPLIYVSFDRSPRNLLDHLGSIAESRFLTVLDCFTHGKGDSADVFLKFYEANDHPPACTINRVEDPGNAQHVMDALYGIRDSFKGEVHFVFESLTGMQALWGGEDLIADFYSHSCPRLYELNTIAYWIVEKRAHSHKFRAKINQIAQVAIDLSVKRGKTFLSVLKAEGRDPDVLNTPHNYWHKDLKVKFDSEKRDTSHTNLGVRLKKLRSKKGISQTELAKRVGVTPSTISQVESNSIYPSLPALFKMAEILSIDISSFFKRSEELSKQVVFSGSDATAIKFPALPQNTLSGKLLTPVDFDSKAEPYLIEIHAGKQIPSHFFTHKGDEIGFLISGTLEMKMENEVRTISPGDVIFLTSETPVQWKNGGKEAARLLWIKIL